jgi:cation diffusion facilitator CzcD-associated flavoprotein CzcO
LQRSRRNSNEGWFRHALQTSRAGGAGESMTSAALGSLADQPTCQNAGGLTANGQPIEHLDVLIVGAGLSGVGAAHHLQEAFPGKSYAIFEAREDLGGTWDLFRYPGIRSDSDMHTLGYRFRPWTDSKTIADGPSILEYVRQTAREGGIEGRIRFQHRAVRAEWSSEEARWSVEAERAGTGETVRVSCDYLWVCSGYYRYDEGFTPEFEGSERFAGPIVHPQHWPEDLDYAGKRVVVIGSGATAVTLVPAMAERAAHVTMLQRSPTYIASLPAEDPVASALRRVLPDRAVYAVVRWKNVLLQTFVYQLSRRRPQAVKRMIRRGVERALPAGYDVDKHFTPRYDPWDQRLCLVPNGDLFRAIREGSASVLTDTIETFTESGIRLGSGEEIEADVIVTATGLSLLFLGGMELVVDGRPIELPKTMTYKGMMLSGVPNCAFTVGYTNASWTLKADLTSEYVCRLLAHMDAHGYTKSVPEITDPTVTEAPLLDFTSGYVQRSLDQFPKQGSKEPWRLRQNYVFDLRAIRRGPLEDGAMQFSRAVTQPRLPLEKVSS